jgi:hypothetical protein
MRKNSPIGQIAKGGQSAISFDLGGHAFFWIGKAEELNRMVWLGVETSEQDAIRLRFHASSDGLTPFDHRPTTVWVSFFLAAVAVENLMKGCLIQVHPEYIAKGKFRGHLMGSHDLLRIGQDAGISLDADERDFCELGTESILTFGRYHTGKNTNDSPTEIRVSAAAFPVYRCLYGRLHDQLLKGFSKNKAEQSTALTSR